MTYELGKNEKGAPYIKCLKCGMKSYHPEDIRHKYCGMCHEFHDNNTPPETRKLRFPVDND